MPNSMHSPLQIRGLSILKLRDKLGKHTPPLLVGMGKLKLLPGSLELSCPGLVGSATLAGEGAVFIMGLSYWCYSYWCLCCFYSIN